jgi:uncharacterized small protein (DUF1192 family)
MMDLDADAWLFNFVEDDLPLMSSAEILHRLAALREIESARYFTYLLKAKGEAREWAIHRDPQAHDGITELRINWLMREIQKRS